MKRIGYNTLSCLATLAFVCVASSAMALTPNPNSIYSPSSSPNFQRYYNDYPQSTVTLTNNYPSSVVWSFDCPFASTGWGEKGVWQLSADGGASHILFPNFSNYSLESDFILDGTNVAHAEGGIEVSPWWNDDGGEFMVNSASHEIVFWNSPLPSFSFNTAFSLVYNLGQPIHEKVRYIAGPSEPSQANPGTVEYSIIFNGLPYSSGIIACGPANPNDPPHGTYGQLDDTKLGGQVLGGPIMPADGGSGAGTITGTWNNINFVNLDAEATPARSSSWGAMKALYR